MKCKLFCNNKVFSRESGKTVSKLALITLLTVSLGFFANQGGEAVGFTEESIVNTPGFPIEPVSGEEPPITPIIGIIGIEQWWLWHGNVTDVVWSSKIRKDRKH